MTDVPAGWYPDPSGIADAYRWWDGAQWTTSLTSDPASPAPTTTEAVRPPTQPDQASAPTQPVPQPTRSVPPPPGAPGPGYVPPPPWATASSGQPPTDVLEVEPTAITGKRKVAVVVAAVIACLALIGAGGYYVVTRDGDTPAAAPTPTPEEQQPEQPFTEPSPEDPGEPAPDETEEAPAPDLPQLTFGPPGGEWTQSDGSTILPRGTAYNLVTENDYDGDKDWVGVISAGYTRAGWFDRDDLQATAERVASWFASTSFNDAPVKQKPISSKPVKVDGHDAYELKKQFDYDIEGIKAKGEVVTIVIVDLGIDETGGVFLASLPDTHKATETAAVTKARDSLRVEE